MSEGNSYLIGPSIYQNRYIFLIALHLIDTEVFVAHILRDLNLRDSQWGVLRLARADYECENEVLGRTVYRDPAQ